MNLIMREKKFKGQLNHAFYEILLVTLFIERPSYKDGMAVETVHVTIRDCAPWIFTLCFIHDFNETYMIDGETDRISSYIVSNFIRCLKFCLN